MKNLWNRISFYIERYPARIAGYISSITVYSYQYWREFPIDISIPVVMLLIILGEASQRQEDKKTLDALYKNPDPKVNDLEEINEIVKHKKSKKHRGVDSSG